jgi:hypothetical protein
VDGWRRFSALRPAQQRAVLDAWARSRLRTRRVVFASLRSILTMGYLGAPSVLRRIGLAPPAVAPPAVEADRLYPPIGRRRSAHAGGAAVAPDALRVFADYEREVEEAADAVVVGSGPCGAVAAYELAAAGHDVVVVEEGPPFTPADFELDGALSMARTMRDGGLRFTRGYAMPTMQAVALGGGSLVNSAICGRCPDFRFEEWCASHELERTTRSDLDPHYDAIEAFLGIAPTPEAVQGRRNLLFRDGCKALGYAAEPTARNAPGCRGSGECFTGCRHRAKQSMDLSYVPAALRLGARVLTSVRVEGIEASGRRATAVVGRVVAPWSGRPSHRVRIRARAVVLAAGVLATPLLLRRSGDLANASGQVGENLQFHPGTSVLGVFPESVEPVFGATQGYQCLQFLREGYKLETLWAPPGVLAVRLPGSGHALQRELPSLARPRARARPQPRALDDLALRCGRRAHPGTRRVAARRDLLRSGGGADPPRRARPSRRDAIARGGRGAAREPTGRGRDGRRVHPRLRHHAHARRRAARRRRRARPGARARQPLDPRHGDLPDEPGREPDVHGHGPRAPRRTRARRAAVARRAAPAPAGPASPGTASRR